jgi:hypothetical protein
LIVSSSRLPVWQTTAGVGPAYFAGVLEKRGEGAGYKIPFQAPAEIAVSMMAAILAAKGGASL